MKHVTTIIMSIGAFAALTLASCNTVAGAGQDIQQGGAAIQNAAADVAH